MDVDLAAKRRYSAAGYAHADSPKSEAPPCSPQLDTAQAEIAIQWLCDLSKTPNFAGAPHAALFCRLLFVSCLPPEDFV